MPMGVQTFTCPRCRRGDFRSLPLPDGKAYCPWCGDLVTSGADPAPPATPAPTPAPAPAPSPAPAVPRDGSEGELRALRDQVADLTRRCEAADAELRHERDRKQEIKKAVMEEVGQLTSRLTEQQALLQRKEDDHRSALAEIARLKEELERERTTAVELAYVRGALEEKDKLARNLETELAGRRKAVADLERARDLARQDAEQMRAHHELARSTSTAELADLRKRVAAQETRLAGLKDADVRLKDADARLEELKAAARRTEDERGRLQSRTSDLQSELAKRDQRIRELQLLIKTLGERLNELADRRARAPASP